MLGNVMYGAANVMLRARAICTYVMMQFAMVSGTQFFTTAVNGVNCE